MAASEPPGRWQAAREAQELGTCPASLPGWPPWTPEGKEASFSPCQSAGTVSTKPSLTSSLPAPQHRGCLFTSNESLPETPQGEPSFPQKGQTHPQASTGTVPAVSSENLDLSS